MRLTIIPDDKFIGIGTTSYSGISTDWSYIPSGVHAVQWDGSSGEVEYTDYRPNVVITSLGVYEAAITHHENERLRRVAQAAADEAQLADKDWDKEFRKIREQLLRDCGWTVGPDTPLSDSQKAEFITYRQALRDLPATISDANERKAMVQAVFNRQSHSGWPTKPTYP